MLHAVNEVPGVYVSLWGFELPIATNLVVEPVAAVLGLVCLFEDAKAVALIREPTSLVNAAVAVYEGTLAISFVLLELTLISLATPGDLEPVAVAPVAEPLPLVDVTV